MAKNTRSAHHIVLGDVKYKDVSHEELVGGRQVPTGVQVIGRILRLTRDKTSRQQGQVKYFNSEMFCNFYLKQTFFRRVIL